MKPGALAVVAALMRTKTSVRRADVSRQARGDLLTPGQRQFFEEKRKLEAERRRDARRAKRAKLAAFIL